MTNEAVLTELQALREQVTGVSDAAVASSDGLLVASDTGEVRPDVLAALAAAALGLSKSAGKEVGMGELREVTIRCAGGHIVVYAVRDKNLLVVLGDEGLDIAHLHLQSRPVVDRLAKLLNPA
ncbi:MULTISPECIES: roadblock/LC7 domain-containing protein [Actinomadura]|uniref:Roadblock/LC7 domain-containing protein n=1 Tax=Actinomadura miaoliensis TaxID=430685 RepID=A0ABP7V5B9_9ACTN